MSVKVFLDKPHVYLAVFWWVSGDHDPNLQTSIHWTELEACSALAVKYWEALITKELWPDPLPEDQTVETLKEYLYEMQARLDDDDHMTGFQIEKILLPEIRKATS